MSQELNIAKDTIHARIDHFVSLSDDERRYANLFGDERLRNISDEVEDLPVGVSWAETEAKLYDSVKGDIVDMVTAVDTTMSRGENGTAIEIVSQEVRAWATEMGREVWWRNGGERSPIEVIEALRKSPLLASVRLDAYRSNEFWHGLAQDVTQESAYLESMNDEDRFGLICDITEQARLNSDRLAGQELNTDYLDDQDAVLDVLHILKGASKTGIEERLVDVASVVTGTRSEGSKTTRWALAPTVELYDPEHALDDTMQSSINAINTLQIAESKDGLLPNLLGINTAMNERDRVIQVGEREFALCSEDGFITAKTSLTEEQYNAVMTFNGLHAQQKLSGENIYNKVYQLFTDYPYGDDEGLFNSQGMPIEAVTDPAHLTFKEQYDKHLTTIEGVEWDYIEEESQSQSGMLSNVLLRGALIGATKNYVNMFSGRVQEQLYKFAYSAGFEVSERLFETSRRLTEDVGKEFVTSFLAAEFGDDFGETLLEVAESTSNEQLTPLLEKVGYIRQQAERFSSQFTGFDDKLPVAVQSNIGELVTEALYVARDVGRDGSARARVLGNKLSVDTISEVLDALDLMARGLERINEAHDSHQITTTYDEDNRRAWHLGLESDVLVQVKPRGEKRGAYVKGLEHSEEAQINYSVDVRSAEGEYVPIDIANYRRRYALSIRLDLEGILRDVNGGRVGFDATRDELAAALDIGSLRGSADNPNVRVARVLSLGNKLRKRQLGLGRSEGYHTKMPAEYGSKQTFAALAEFMTEKYRQSAAQLSLGEAALGRLSHQPPASPAEKAAA